MSASVNPNPRGFRLKSLFVDMDRVVAVTRSGQASHTQIHFDGKSDAVVVVLSEESHEELLRAVEMYKSGR